MCEAFDAIADSHAWLDTDRPPHGSRESNTVTELQRAARAMRLCEAFDAMYTVQL